MSDDFCPEHGYEFMHCDKVWGAIPYCVACDAEQERKNDHEKAERERKENPVFFGVDQGSCEMCSEAEVERLPDGTLLIKNVRTWKHDLDLKANKPAK